MSYTEERWISRGREKIDENETDEKDPVVMKSTEGAQPVSVQEHTVTFRQKTIYDLCRDVPKNLL